MLHVVAADRWTGAAATALQLAESLHEAGIDCRFVFRPGRGLETRLAGVAWCQPLLPKVSGPSDLRHGIAVLRGLVAASDVVHAHLPQDHLLARLAGAGRRAPLVRSIHCPGHLRPHPYYRWLLRGTAGLGLANSALTALLRRVPALRDVPYRVLPISLETRFGPSDKGPAARARFGVPADAVLAGTIGKLERDRGHDLFLRALSAAHGVWGMVIGKGPYLEKLQQLARDLGIGDRVVWPGYVEDGLEELYAAMDLFVFPAAGSDWAHRAIAEAAACGVPALAADLPGVRDLLDPGVTGELYPQGDASTLATLLREWAAYEQRRRTMGAAAARAAARWTPAALAAVAVDLYRQVGAQVHTRLDDRG